MQSLSLIITEGEDEAALRDRLEGTMRSWYKPFGIRPVFAGRTTDQPDLTIEAWADEGDPPVRVELVHDAQARCRYVSVLSDDDQLRRNLWGRLRANLETASLDVLRDTAHREGDADPSAYLRLALATGPGIDEATMAALRSGMRSRDADARAQATIGAAMLGWPQFRADAEAALAGETDEGVVRLLHALISSLGEAGS